MIITMTHLQELWLCVVGILCVTCVYAAPKSHKHVEMKKEPEKIATTPISLDDIFNSSLDYRSFSVNWVNGQDVYLFEDDDGNVLSFDMTTNVTELLVNGSIIEEVGASRYWLSNDLRYTLLAYEYNSLWRYSFTAKYKIYDRVGGRLIDFPNDDGLRNTALQLVEWAPTGHGLVFVSGNNLYYQADPDAVSQQVTFTGQDKYIFNGITDWLYEEEILFTYVANWFSANGEMMCYGMFNDTNVPLFKFPYYGPKTDVYGDIVEFTYPKAGVAPGANTKGYLYVFNTSNPSAPHVKLQPPAELATVDHYFTQVSWRDSSTVTIMWANRIQNHTITTVCHIDTGLCSQNVERSVAGGWISPGQYIWYIEGGAGYLTILPRLVMNNDTWSHLAFVTSPESSEGLITFLTDGQEEVKSIAGYEEDRKLVYYISTNGDPRKRHLFRVGTPLSDPSFHTPECITCDQTPEYDYVYTDFSSTGRYYVLTLTGPNIPHYYLKSTQTTFSELKEDNADIAANLAEKIMPVKQFMQVPIGGGYMAWAELLIPPAALDPDNTDTFPLLVDTYSGPSSQAVDVRFPGTGFDSYMVSSNNVVYVQIDGRGTASRGDTYKYTVYKALGTKEIDDQIAGASYLRDNLDYIDKVKRPGVTGWSYGGFASAHAVGNSANFYGCGMIGAMVSDYRYYDAAYTERLMGFPTPEDNQSGYDDTDVMRKADLFQNKTILVVHGTADDNVHFTNAMQFVKALQDADIQFRMQAYPDLNHYFSGSSMHLFELYTDFWLNDCWGTSTPIQQATVKT